MAFVLVAALADRVLDAVDAVGQDGPPLAEQRPLLALLVLLGRAALDLDRLGGLEGGNHQTAVYILQEVDGESGRVDRLRLNRRDTEGHWEEFGAGLGDCLGAGIVERVSSDTEAQGIARVRVDLRDVEGLCEVAERGREKLDACNVQALLVRADLKV